MGLKVFQGSQVACEGSRPTVTSGSHEAAKCLSWGGDTFQQNRGLSLQLVLGVTAGLSGHVGLTGQRKGDEEK